MTKESTAKKSVETRLVVELELPAGNLHTRQLADVSGAAKSVEVIRVLQITDCHLGEERGEKLAGMDTDESLDYVIRRIASRKESPDLLLATGDLANHGSAAAYHRLEQKLTDLPAPVLWLPGNHDDLPAMRNAVTAQRLPRLVLAGSWAIIMLDSTVPGEVGGTLGEAELQQLAETLQQLPADCHIMICVHHQVLPVGSDWLDQQQITDSDKLIEQLRGDRRLRIVVSGHVHQDRSDTDPRLPGVQFLTSPSTCIQFAPQTKDFKLDDELPGYRWFDLHANGQFDTGVERVEGVELSMDLASSGY